MNMLAIPDRNVQRFESRGQIAVEFSQIQGTVWTNYSIECNPDETPIEAGDRILVQDVKIETSFSGWKKTHVLSFERMERNFKAEARIHGLAAKTLESLAKQLGENYVAIIAVQGLSALEKTKFSKRKRDLIAECCAAEHKVRTEISLPHLVCALVAAGMSTGDANNALKAGNLPALTDKNYCGLYALYPAQITFRKADLATKFLCEKDFDYRASDARRRAIILNAAEIAGNELGHTLLSRREITDIAWRNFQVPFKEIDRLITEQIKAGELIQVATSPRACEGRREDNQIGFARNVRAEQSIAEIISRNSPIASADHNLMDTIIQNAARLMKKPDFVVSKQQSDFCHAAISNRISCLTGPPGSGKTACMFLLHFYFVARKLPCLGVSFAARAATVLASATALPADEDLALAMPCKTIHSALKLRPGEEGESKAREISERALFIDEAGMLPSWLMAQTLVAARTCEHVILCGDVDQLQPIGCGAPFLDMISSGVPTGRLTGNHRAKGKGIAALIKDMRAGRIDQTFERYEMLGGVEFIEAAKGSQRAEIAAEIHADLAPEYHFDEIAILAPIHAGDSGVKRAIELTRVAGPPRVGDVVLVTQNNYHAPDLLGSETSIANGERGVITNVGVDTLILDLASLGSDEQPRRVVLDFSGGCLPDGFAFGRAMTVHKAQGSGFETVILLTRKPSGPVGMRTPTRASIYTAVSRASENLFIIGSASEFQACIANIDLPRRTVFNSKSKGR